jgi:hypothetical protein
MWVDELDFARWNAVSDLPRDGCLAVDAARRTESDLETSMSRKCDSVARADCLDCLFGWLLREPLDEGRLQNQHRAVSFGRVAAPTDESDVVLSVTAAMHSWGYCIDGDHVRVD